MFKIFHQYRRGMTLVEIVVAVTIITSVAISFSTMYSRIVRFVALSRARVVALQIVNERIEIIRNLPFQDVGTYTGIPRGRVDQEDTVVQNGQAFFIETIIRNVDDPYDGLIGGTPNDLSPADYRLVEITVSCTSCVDFTPITISTFVAPKNLEGSTANGAIVVRAVDSNGAFIPQADVRIRYVYATTTPIDIIDQTNNSGFYQVVDVPPAINGYEVTVSKPGFTTDKTYATSTVLTIPAKPNLTVVAGSVTQVTLSIDRESQFSFSSVRPSCAAVSGYDFNVRSSKKIGEVDVWKLNSNLQTNGSGVYNLPALEWDNYSLTPLDADYDLAGTDPILPLQLAPSTTQNVRLIVRAKVPRSLLVTVRDNVGPVTGATTTISEGGFSETLVTGQGYMTQTDWSGGSGQNNFSDETRYHSSDGNIRTSSPAGTLSLATVLGDYVPSGYITSSVFDTGAANNFGDLTWYPVSQPGAAGPDSVRFQVASANTNDGSTVWNYIGPDGSSASYYTISNRSLALHNSNQYLRYRAYLSTATTTVTPTLSDITFSYTASCVPPGQVLFRGLDDETYTLTVEKEGKTTKTVDIPISASWQSVTINLDE
jgi:prepilin-type N-terminal cleavage/methylation domain-containing protein